MNRSPMNGIRPPFELPSDIVYFFDWRYVDHGYLRWLGPDDQPVAMMPAPDPLPSLHASSEWLPKGIRIETIPGTVDQEPTLRAAEMGEILFFGGSVVKDQGSYRMFYESIPPAGMLPENLHRMGHFKVLRYAESDDSMHWRFPKLGLVELDSSKDNNIVFDPGPVGYHGGCVFLDEHGPAAERYKSVWLGFVSQQAFERYRERWPDDIDPMAVFPPEYAHTHPGMAGWGLFGATSPDGLHWTLLEDPLLIQHSDTFQACSYDPLLGKYVVYPRTWYYDRRAVGRAESDDFRHFTALQQVLWPDPSMRATDTWYTPGYTTMPGAPDYRLMFNTLWSQVDDTFTPILHSSPDGLLWQRIPGRPMLQHDPMGSWHACGGAITSLVELPGDQVGAFIMGWHVPHKYPRSFPGFGQAGWVRWQRGRLTALRADENAEFALYPLKVKGHKLVLNFKTKPSGFIRVSVCGTKPYRSIEDCDLLCGDELDRVVTWKGESNLGYPDGEGIKLSFHMRACDLYCVRFE